MRNSVERFTGLVERYTKYRSEYPQAVVDFLVGECGVTAESTIADIGSGTGALAKMLLDYGSRVYAVEPNAEMRAAAERRLAGYDRLVSVDATAEATTLGDSSVDLVTAGRAFHWFDAPSALVEWARILRPHGVAVVIWHRRQDPPTTPVLAAYDDLLMRYCDDYPELVGRRRAAIAFLEKLGFKLTTIAMPRALALRQLEGLVLSLSVSPPKGHPKHEPMLQHLRTVFREHQVNRRVVLDYVTSIYYGRPPR